MKTLMRIALLILLPLSVFADGLDLNLNNESARFNYFSDTGQNAQTEIGFLYNEDEFKLGHLGIHIVDSTGSKSQGLNIALGGRLYGLYNDPVDVFAVGIGGALIFTPPQVAYGRLNIVLAGHFAPEIVTFGDGDSFNEYAGMLEYQILAQGYIYGGYRRVRLKLDPGGRVDVDKGGVVGLRIEF